MNEITTNRSHHKRAKSNYDKNLMVLFPMEDFKYNQEGHEEKPKTNFIDLMKPLPSIPLREASHTIDYKNEPIFSFKDPLPQYHVHSYTPHKAGTFEKNPLYNEENPIISKAIEQNNSVNLLYGESPMRKGHSTFRQAHNHLTHPVGLESPLNPSRSKINNTFKISLFKNEEIQHFHHLNKAENYYESNPDLPEIQKQTSIEKGDTKRLSLLGGDQEEIKSSKLVSFQVPEEAKEKGNSKSKEDLMNAMMMAFSKPNYKNIKAVGIKTEAGTLDGKKKKTNQDSLIFFPEFMGIKDRHLFAILDGHGNKGHDVSQYVKKEFPVILESKLKKTDNIENALFEAIAQCSDELDFKSGIDTNFSGTTANFLLMNGNQFYSANIGDSRSILINEEQGPLVSQDITVDHKPDDEKEKKRIEENGGRVEAIIDNNGKPNGPARVWLKGQNYPGLAMSRSLGDQCGHKAGVSSIPDIKVHTLNPKNKIIVLASDGVWEFLNGQNVLDIINPFYLTQSVDKACEALVQNSTQNWKNEDVVVDDITVIVIFLQIG